MCTGLNIRRATVDETFIKIGRKTGKKKQAKPPADRQAKGQEAKQAGR